MSNVILSPERKIRKWNTWIYVIALDGGLIIPQIFENIGTHRVLKMIFLWIYYANVVTRKGG